MTVSLSICVYISDDWRPLPQGDCAKSQKASTERRFRKVRPRSSRQSALYHCDCTTAVRQRPINAQIGCNILACNISNVYLIRLRAELVIEKCLNYANEIQLFPACRFCARSLRRFPPLGCSSFQPKAAMKPNTSYQLKWKLTAIGLLAPWRHWRRHHCQCASSAST